MGGCAAARGRINIKPFADGVTDIDDDLGAVEVRNP